jgi:hypothetical protein
MNRVARFLYHRFQWPIGWFVLLLMLAPAGYATQRPESPAQPCLPPYQPANEAELNAAIACVNSAGAGAHAITLATDITLTGSTTPLANPLAEQLAVQGNGHTIDGAGVGTIFTIQAGTTALINNVTLTGGQGEWGGAIYNLGQLTLTNSAVAGNNAAYGGGIANRGDGEGVQAELTIADTTLSGNTATSAGGGIHSSGVNGGIGSLVLINSTISGNSAGAGGGLFIEGNGGNAGANTVFITVADNVATDGGSGIHVSATNGAASVLLHATLLANGPDGPDCATTGGNIISYGYNLAGDASCNLTQDNDQPSTPAGLLPLTVNPPGATATHALGYGSPAVDRVPFNALGCGSVSARDQRDAPRPQPEDGLCDIGAFERGPGDPLGHYLFLPVNPIEGE